jgi:hypothetical protein
VGGQGSCYIIISTVARSVCLMLAVMLGAIGTSVSLRVYYPAHVLSSACGVLSALQCERAIASSSLPHACCSCQITHGEPQRHTACVRSDACRGQVSLLAFLLDFCCFHIASTAAHTPCSCQLSVHLSANFPTLFTRLSLHVCCLHCCYCRGLPLLRRQRPKQQQRLPQITQLLLLPALTGIDGSRP